jgi:hypothetical protein
MPEEDGMAGHALLRRDGSTALSLSSARLRNLFRSERWSNGTSNSPRRALRAPHLVGKCGGTQTFT